MSIRIALLSLMVFAMAVYAWRDWFKSLCGLILLMAVMQHPDMPKNILGIQGLNPWNLLMISIALAWLANRRQEGLDWDMPPLFNGLLLIYLGVVVIGFFRMMTDLTHLDEISTEDLVSEYLINTVKWVIPGLLLFDGCRTQRRLVMALACILILYILFAVQVIRWMPASAALSGASLTERSRKIISNEIGYHAVNMSMMLSGACWAILATLTVVKRGWHRAGVVAAALLVAYGQALTAGRMGYVTWGIVGLLLCLLRWRKALLPAALVPMAVAVALPGVTDRMLMGFGATDVSGETYTNDYQVTAGRTLIWPYVIDKIAESPAIGFGRLAMARTGLEATLWEELREQFTHPHNAYLEFLLDNGLMGFLLVMPFYAVVIFHAVRLFLDRKNPWYGFAGGVCLALVLALFVAAMGSQTFYPREGAVGMWAAIGLMLRVSVERQRNLATSRVVTARYPATAPLVAQRA